MPSGGRGNHQVLARGAMDPFQGQNFMDKKKLKHMVSFYVAHTVLVGHSSRCFLLFNKAGSYAYP
jgi:hypothetical protein